MISRFLFLCLTGIIGLLASTTSHAQIVQDGSFEAAGYAGDTALNVGSSSTVNGWTFGVHASAGSGGAGNAKWLKPGSDGVASEHHIEIDSKNPTGIGHVYAQTTMTGLVVGQIYMVSFASEKVGGSPSELAVYINGSTTASGTYTPGATWATSTLYFTATSASETLRFEDNATGTATSKFALDAVSVVSTTPEPNSVGVAAVLIVGIGCVERRRLRGIFGNSRRLWARWRT